MTCSKSHAKGPTTNVRYGASQEQRIQVSSTTIIGLASVSDDIPAQLHDLINTDDRKNFLLSVLNEAIEIVESDLNRNGRS